jgi:hypothetical protein
MEVSLIQRSVAEKTHSGKTLEAANPRNAGCSAAAAACIGRLLEPYALSCKVPAHWAAQLSQADAAKGSMVPLQGLWPFHSEAVAIPRVRDSHNARG